MAERHHAAEAGPPHVREPGLLLEPARHREAVRVVRRDAQVQGPQAAVHEEAVEGAGHRADRVLDEAQTLVEGGLLDDRRTADRVGVAAEVLRGRVHHRVRAELERALVDRGRERIVDRHERAALALDHAREVDDVERRVGRRLDPDQHRVVAYGALERVEVALVHHVVLEAEAREHLVDEPVGAAVEVVGQDHVRAGARDRRDERVLGGHARGERGGVPALQRAQRRLERRARRVGRARVVEVVDELAGRKPADGGGLVDRRDDRAVAGVGREPGVHAARRELGHETSDSSRSARVTMPIGRPCSVTVRAWRSPASSSTASRTESVTDTAGNGSSITSAISRSISDGAPIARLSSPRSPTEPTIDSGSCVETTGSWETRCSCRSAIASRTLWAVCTTTKGGISPAASFARRTSPTVLWSGRSRKPYWVIHASLKILER